MLHSYILTGKWGGREVKNRGRWGEARSKKRREVRSKKRREVREKQGREKRSEEEYIIEMSILPAQCITHFQPTCMNIQLVEDISHFCTKYDVQQVCCCLYGREWGNKNNQSRSPLLLITLRRFFKYTWVLIIVQSYTPKCRKRIH